MGRREGGMGWDAGMGEGSLRERMGDRECVCERERENEREKEKERKKERERASERKLNIILIVYLKK
jgi:hypothetical protein